MTAGGDTSGDPRRRPRAPRTDPASELDRLRVVLSAILLWGVMISSAVLVVGIAQYLFVGHSGYPSGAYPRTPLEEASGLLALKPYAVIGLGLLMLALTPVVRVAAELVIFLRDRTWWFVAFAGYTFAILVVSFVFGRVI